MMFNWGVAGSEPTNHVRPPPLPSILLQGHDMSPLNVQVSVLSPVQRVSHVCSPRGL